MDRPDEIAGSAPDYGAAIKGFLVGLQALSKITPVYPMYLAHRAKEALLGQDPEGIIASVGDIQTIGDARYGVPVTDVHGQKYRITVEVMP